MPIKWRKRVSYTNMAKRNPNTYYAVDRKKGLLFKFRHRDQRQKMIRDNPGLKDIDSTTYRELARKHTFVVQDFTATSQSTAPNIGEIAKAVADALKPYVRKSEVSIAGEQPVAARSVTDH